MRQPAGACELGSASTSIKGSALTTAREVLQAQDTITAKVTVAPRLRIHIHFGMACMTFSSMARGGNENPRGFMVRTCRHQFLAGFFGVAPDCLEAGRRLAGKCGLLI
jgi:hypothetical protein